MAGGRGLLRNWATVAVAAAVAAGVPSPSGASDAPNLWVENLTWTPEFPNEGDEVTFQVTVRNGGGDAGAFHVRAIVQHSDTTNHTVGDAPVASLPAGAAVTVSIGGWEAHNGLFTIWGLADVFDAVAESNEVFNAKRLSLKVGPADLVPTHVNTNPIPPRPGSTYALLALVSNPGGKPTGPFEVRFLVDGTPMGTASQGSMGPLTSTWVWGPPWTVPSGGTFVVRAEVDVGQTVEEENEGNNAKEQTYVVGDVNLVPTDLGVPEDGPFPPLPGSSLRFTATITNGGAGATNAFHVRFLLDGAQLGPDQPTNFLAAGASKALESEAWSATPGRHAVRVVADPVGAIPESNETDNALEAGFVVLGPDLRPETVGATTAPVKETHPVSFSAIVHNAEAVAAGPFEVRFLVDGQPAGAPVAVGGLPGGESVTITSTAVALEAGLHTVEALADTADEVSEMDEGNNDLSATFQVLRFGVGLNPHEQSGTALPPTPKTYTLTAVNLGELPDTIDVAHSPPPPGWIASLSASEFSLGPGESASVQLTVTPLPGSLEPAVIDVTATSRGNPAREDSGRTTTSLGLEVVWDGPEHARPPRPNRNG